MVHTGTDNNLDNSSVIDINLWALNQGAGTYFMNLDTGRKIHSHVWTELPISLVIIWEVEHIAKKEK